jgi:hypothetical protein
MLHLSGIIALLVLGSIRWWAGFSELRRKIFSGKRVNGAVCQCRDHGAVRESSGHQNGVR